MFVVESRALLEHRLVAVPQKPFAAVIAAELTENIVAGARHQVFVTDCKSRIADDAQKGAVGFLRERFTRQQRDQGVTGQ